MIVNSQSKQLRLQDDGHILWQPDASNPLPGQPVARIYKGDNQLKPKVELLESAIPDGEDKAATLLFIQSWLDQHIATVLEVLHGLVNENNIAGPAKDIAQKVHDALGILPRQEIESEIAGLDPEARKILRQRHVRLGPILVFVPELNKPAAVRLRALLWWLWHDRSLPAPVPKDGAVSVVVDPAQSDPVYYRAIGYPLYADRAIRVDMLDRVISAVYDGAKEGNFKATHAMAEWLGCSIPDLYKTLEAMGHKKIHDPAEQVPAAAVEASPDGQEAQPLPPETAETPVTELAADAAPSAEKVVASPPPAKPELATFRLKRGKANESGRPPREERAAAPKFTKKPEGKDRKPKPRREKFQREEKRPVSFEARPKHIEDSPFAVLQQLKAGNSKEN